MVHRLPACLVFSPTASPSSFFLNTRNIYPKSATTQRPTSTILLRRDGVLHYIDTFARACFCSCSVGCGVDDGIPPPLFVDIYIRRASDHDKNTKLKSARKFLKKGLRVRVCFIYFENTRMLCVVAPRPSCWAARALHPPPPMPFPRHHATSTHSR